MNPIHNELKKEFQVERMILFSDAVFAIAITLLALEIKVPELADNVTESSLLSELARLIPKFVGFLISFFLVGLYWTIHHRMFGFVVNFTRKLIWLNLFFLLSIVMMPFSTGIFGEYSSPHSIYLKTPLIIYVLNICFTGVMNYLLWCHIANPANKISEGIPNKAFVQAAKIRALVVPVVFALAIPIDFVNPYLARYTPMLIPLVMKLLKKRFEKRITVKE